MKLSAGAGALLHVARIVLNTFGSLGDLNPYLAIAMALRGRGHEVRLATSAVYREKVQAEGVEFAAVRPDVGELLDHPELIEKLWDARTGSEFLIREYILPRLEESYEDLLEACRGAELVVTHVAGYGGPIAAEALKIPWVSLVLQPMVFFSAYDPPVIPGAAWLRHLYGLGPNAFRALLAAGRSRVDSWAEPIAALRARLGLPGLKANPLLGGQFSSTGTLSLFSRHFAGPQRDWPAKSRQTGFIFYDRQGRIRGASEEGQDFGSEVERFLAAGPAPVLFTLGSSAVTHPGAFFRESLAAAEAAGQRAVLLTGPLDKAELPQPVPESILIASYLPYSEIMPRVAAIVHQGGIGTVAQVLRSGRPSLVVPWAHDQPDNAARLARLGVARTMPRGRYRAGRVARELSRLLGDDAYRAHASELGKKIAAEDGLADAVGALERIIESS